MNQLQPTIELSAVWSIGSQTGAFKVVTLKAYHTFKLEPVHDLNQLQPTIKWSLKHRKSKHLWPQSFIKSRDKTFCSR